jgi:hypothetical protein
VHGMGAESADSRRAKNAIAVVDECSREVQNGEF